MKKTPLLCRPSFHSILANVVGVTLLIISNACVSNGSEIEGYAEPYRTINVAADETGTIGEVYVREGQEVKAGQELVRLNSQVHFALLAIAKQNMQAAGRIDAAMAEFELRRDRLAKLEKLRHEGHARQEEVDRASSEYAVSEANIRVAQEDLLSKRLEFERIKTQIARRTVRAPLAGTVTVLQKDIGEFVAPTSPDIITLVQLDKLLVNFTLMNTETKALQVGQQMKIQFLTSQLDANGVVEFISPVTDAESGTVQIKVCVDNSKGFYRSGERCAIRIGE